MLNKRNEIVKEFNESNDFFKRKKLIQENKNIVQQIQEIRGKQATKKREKLLKSTGDFQKKLDYFVVKNEKIISSIVKIENDCKEAVDKWVALKEEKNEIWKQYENLRGMQKASTDELETLMHKYRATVGLYNQQRDIVNQKKAEKYKAINNVLRIKDGALLNIATSTKSKQVKQALNDVKELLDGLIPVSILPKEPIEASALPGGKGRAHYSNFKNKLELANDDDVCDVAHEIMHWLEKKNPKIGENSLIFLEHRTKGETARPLKEITKNNTYDKEEIAKPDNFFDPYCGKIYNHDATEIMSMGIEKLFEDPSGFAKEDKEYMAFVISNLRGEL